MSNLMTVCTKCHTSKNHQPDGKLYGLKSKSSNLANSAFMNTVRYVLVNDFKEEFPDVRVFTTYGAETKLKRQELHISKTHANDAYAMGQFRPKHRTKEECFIKCRRNNRILSLFYDAKYIDIRDGQRKTGKELSCNRTNRREPRNSDKNERIYRGQKISKGRVSIRKNHYSIRPGDLILFENRKYTAKGVQNNGTQVKLENSKVVSINRTETIFHTNGWKVL